MVKKITEHHIPNEKIGRESISHLPLKYDMILIPKSIEYPFPFVLTFTSAPYVCGFDGCYVVVVVVFVHRHSFKCHIPIESICWPDGMGVLSDGVYWMQSDRIEGVKTLKLK